MSIQECYLRDEKKEKSGDKKALFETDTTLRMQEEML